MISKETYDIIMANAERLNSAIVYDRDFGYNYFGFKTMERSYLLKIDKKRKLISQFLFADRNSEYRVGRIFKDLNRNSDSVAFCNFIQQNSDLFI